MRVKSRRHSISVSLTQSHRRRVFQTKVIPSSAEDPRDRAKAQVQESLWRTAMALHPLCLLSRRGVGQGSSWVPQASSSQASRQVAQQLQRSHGICTSAAFVGNTACNSFVYQRFTEIRDSSSFCVGWWVRDVFALFKSVVCCNRGLELRCLYEIHYNNPLIMLKKLK